MNYRVQVARDQAALALLEEPWTALIQACSSATVFASFQWNAMWWRHFGAGKKLNVLAIWDEQNRLVGIAPLMVSRLGPVRKLEFIGTGLSDYGDLLADPEHEPAVISAILSYLRANHSNWDLGDLSEVPPQSPLLAQLARMRAHAPEIEGLTLADNSQTPCPVIELPGTWEEYVSRLLRKRKYYVSSYPRKFLKEHNGSLEVLTGGPQLDAAVLEFYRLHMARWQHRADSISAEHLHPEFLPFLKDVCAACAAAGWLRLVTLKAGDQIVASTINFMMHRRWTAYMKGFDPRWSDSRPGTVLDTLRIVEAIKEGARYFDFGRGDEEYKSGFGVTIYRNRRVLLATRAPRSMAALTLLSWRIRNAQRRRALEEQHKPGGLEDRVGVEAG
jgi:CelD/BcsL family acetyltransferase involved in cellulose biosynthesis